MSNPYSANQYPDLSLAMTPDTLPGGQVMASGQQETRMPIPLPVIPREQPMLQCSDPGMEINQMGISPTVPYFDLGLAMSPDNSMEPQYPQAKDPTFTAPMMTWPSAKPYDLQAPGIDHIPEFAPDPYTGDLLDFDRPVGLSPFAVNQGNPLVGPPDPTLPDTSVYDRPDNLLMPSTMQVDPMLPDLQRPQIDQDVHMHDRPGDAVDSDGNPADLGSSVTGDDSGGPMPVYQQDYQMPGMSHRQRKQDMLFHGLKGDL